MKSRVNDTRLLFDTEGSALQVDGQKLVGVPAIVALHGGPGFDHGYLRPGLSPLSRDHQIVYVDLRGQGRSDRPSIESCTLEQMADDVIALTATIGLDRPIVFGHSAGGFVALLATLRHPGAIGGLILCATSATLAPITDASPPPSLAERAGPEAVVVFDRLFSGELTSAALDAFKESVAPFYAGPGHTEISNRLNALSTLTPDIMRHFFTHLAAGYDVRQQLEDITIPTLVIAGSEDWLCPPATARLIDDAINSARLIVIDGAGHYAFSEEPEAFQSAVRNFTSQFRHER